MPGTPGLEKIREVFGDRVLYENGELNREALRRIVFSNPVARDSLNQIVHPAVAGLRDLEYAAARDRGDRIVISDIPLLFETGLEHAFDAVVFVDAPERTRLERLMAIRHLPEVEAQAMMHAQGPAAEKRARSTFVLENGSTVDALAAQVDALWNSLQDLAQSRVMRLDSSSERSG